MVVLCKGGHEKGRRKDKMTHLGSRPLCAPQSWAGRMECSTIHCAAIHMHVPEQEGVALIGQDSQATAMLRALTCDETGGGQHTACRCCAWHGIAQNSTARHSSAQHGSPPTPPPTTTPHKQTHRGAAGCPTAAAAAAAILAVVLTCAFWPLQFFINKAS